MTDRLQTSEQLTLGARIAIDGRLNREFETVDDGSYRSGHKLWKREMLVNPQFGILVGYRLLSNGRIFYGEEGPEYKPVDYFKAALVTTSVRTKPFLVRLDDIKAAPL